MQEHSPILKPNPKGIYTLNSLWPVIGESTKIFDKNGRPLDYDRVEELKTSVFNENGKLLINEYILKNLPHTVNRHGFYPISALQLLKHIVDKAMRAYCQYASPFTNDSAVHNYITSESSDLLTSGQLENYVIDVNEEIFNFVCDDRWNIYFTKVKRDNLYIEKTIDYRIYDWTRIMHERHNTKESE